MTRPVYLIWRKYHNDPPEVVHKEYSEKDAAEFCLDMNRKWNSFGWHYSYTIKADATQSEK